MIRFPRWLPGATSPDVAALRRAAAHLDANRVGHNPGGFESSELRGVDPAMGDLMGLMADLLTATVAVLGQPPRDPDRRGAGGARDVWVTAVVTWALEMSVLRSGTPAPVLEGLLGYDLNEITQEHAGTIPILRHKAAIQRLIAAAQVPGPTAELAVKTAELLRLLSSGSGPMYPLRVWNYRSGYLWYFGFELLVLRGSQPVVDAVLTQPGVGTFPS